MEIYFCNGWFIAQKRATQLWHEAQAEAAHRSGQPYTALVGSATSPTHVVEVRKDSVGVAFLDEHRREYRVHSFDEVSSGKLYLSMVVVREFEGDSDKIAVGSSYLYSQAGKLFVKQEIATEEMMDTAEAYVDLTDHWEPYPEFGEYSSLCREDRDIFLPDLRREPEQDDGAVERGSEGNA